MTPATSDTPIDDRSSRLDQWLVRAGERLNPILVKETRQAMKSRQFSLTFTLLLVCGWCWTVFRITSLSPGIAYVPSGASLLHGYFLILVIPMLIVIPFSAFRSLAAEREDGTFELLAITSLGARQIVTGKLGSAVLQMVVFYSVLSPCIVFTYLLRGIDIVTIFVLLLHTFLLSLALSTIGLLCATITRSRHWQTLLSVLLVLGLALCAFTWSVWVSGVMLEFGLQGMDESEFWMAQLAIVSVLGSFSVLFVTAAAGQISFASDNRATRLRLVMLGQQTLFVAWMIYFGLIGADREVIEVFMAMGGFYWAIAASIMAGESAQISPRAQRELPESLLGRLLLTWLYPGSGTGFVFAVANITSLAIAAGCLCLSIEAFSPSSRLASEMDVLYFVAIVPAYLVLYVGTGRLLYLFATRYSAPSLLLAFLINVILAIAGMAAPWMLEAWLNGFSPGFDYSWLQFPNWAWTLGELTNRNFSSTVAGSALTVFLLAAIVGVVNLLVAGDAVRKRRQSAPLRIVQDEQELHPPPAPARQSPWDD